MNIWYLKKKKTQSDNNDPWNDKLWEKKITKRLYEHVKNIKNDKKIKIETFSAESPLPVLLLNYNKKNIKILEIGSGSLEVPLKIAFDTKIKKKIHIYVVEKKNILNIYKKNIKKMNFPKNFKFFFSENINFSTKYDIVHFSDVIQYISDWKILLNKIKKNNASFIVFNNLTAGEIPTYQAYQKFYNFEIPYRFFNISEIINVLKPYNLIYKTKFLNKIKGKYIGYPQKNFKKKLRLGNPCSLIFSKKF